MTRAKMIAMASASGICFVAALMACSSFGAGDPVSSPDSAAPPNNGLDAQAVDADASPDAGSAIGREILPLVDGGRSCLGVPESIQCFDFDDVAAGLPDLTQVQQYNGVVWFQPPTGPLESQPNAFVAFSPAFAEGTTNTPDAYFKTQSFTAQQRVVLEMSVNVEDKGNGSTNIAEIDLNQAGKSLILYVEPSGSTFRAFIKEFTSNPVFEKSHELTFEEKKWVRIHLEIDLGDKKIFASIDNQVQIDTPLTQEWSTADDFFQVSFGIRQVFGKTGSGRTEREIRYDNVVIFSE